MAILLNYCVCACMSAWVQKVLVDLVDFQHIVSPSCCKLATNVLAGSVHAECYPGVDNSCPCQGKCMCEPEVTCTSKCPVFQHGFLPNAASLDCLGFTSLCSLLPTTNDLWASYSTLQIN